MELSEEDPWFAGDDGQFELMGMTPQMPVLKPISKYNKKFESEAIMFSPKLHV